MILYDKRVLKIFAGNSNKDLAEEICRYLNVPLGQADVSRFPDGEIKVKIEESVRVKMFLSFNLPVHPPMNILWNY